MSAGNLGDGSTGSAMITDHSDSSAGSYTVILTITDGDGLRDTTNMAHQGDHRSLSPGVEGALSPSASRQSQEPCARCGVEAGGDGRTELA